MESGAKPRVLIVGGGYVGLYTALGLRRRLRSGEAEITLVTPESFMTYQPFLPEAASGNIEPRHVVVPLRTVLHRRVRLITGVVTGIDHDRRIATVRSSGGEPSELPYDVVVIGLGSVSRVLPVPGLTERAVGFKTVAEAIYLRNQVLSRMDFAESTTDTAARTRALTFLFVGGGYAGVEALAELEDLARDACRYYATVRREDMRWVLVEAAAGILPEIGSGLGEYAMARLRRRGIEVHLETRLESALEGHMVLSSGESFDADTLVWTTGVRAHPLLARLGFPLDERGRLIADEFLRVKGVEGAWTAGDGAAIPDLTTGGVAPPTAQHALREARRLAKNVAAMLHGRRLRPFRYRNMGQLVSLGRYKGVARVLGMRLRGFPAWFLHRSYHVSRIPTFNRKVRVILDWTVALFFRRDVVQLGSLQHPREPFEEAAGGSVDEPVLGIRANLGQFSLLVVINAFVGAMVGQERSLLTIVAKEEFGIASATAATSFLIAFGLVKAFSNLVAGGLADRFGRRRVLLAGWAFGLPVPFALAFAPGWGWIVAANGLLGVNQGLAWSTTVVMKVDLAGPRRRGLATGLNEFSGYLAVGGAAFGAAAIAARLGEVRPWPFLMGAAIGGAGLVLSLFVRETHGHALGESLSSGDERQPSVRQAFALSTWRDRRLAGCSQAGLVNNANDAVIWALFPLLAAANGMSIARLGLVAGAYPAVWGVSQLITGPASDRLGRRPLIVAGLLVQAGALVGLANTTGFGPWMVAAVLLGVGTALVYPTLLAAVADYSAPRWRGSAIGGYRFWRDAGYAVGGLAAGVLAQALGVRSAIAVLGAVTAGSAAASAMMLPGRG